MRPHAPPTDEQCLQHRHHIQASCPLAATLLGIRWRSPLGASMRHTLAGCSNTQPFSNRHETKKENEGALTAGLIYEVHVGWLPQAQRDRHALQLACRGGEGGLRVCVGEPGAKGGSGWRRGRGAREGGAKCKCATPLTT